jgi:hypothetical protein
VAQRRRRVPGGNHCFRSLDEHNVNSVCSVLVLYVLWSPNKMEDATCPACSFRTAAVPSRRASRLSTHGRAPGRGVWGRSLADPFLHAGRERELYLLQEKKAPARQHLQQPCSFHIVFGSSRSRRSIGGLLLLGLRVNSESEGFC